MDWRFDNVPILDVKNTNDISKFTWMSVNEYLEALSNDSPKTEGMNEDLHNSPVIVGRIHTNTPTRTDSGDHLHAPLLHVQEDELHKRKFCSSDFLSVGTSSTFAEPCSEQQEGMDCIFTDESYNIQE
ncbi:hypothetical protein GUITHDRAFT_151335 [Guillardia theta CCMP2712]|uniref:Uncharacterized protein n=2 Tax=Guillardia theta TaxID=55529 RepID=L1JMX3_GUITC|nr:hypothetical protein GUITHDRAFT_151335 [Guillardia theta CCMP2712]EKX49941.1 hypothetical protein GUITHDRAFT_151335 [Guillardia theta CCMP2712]|eukprot:XP_005836921.1 hypothetical protein GUITHDRAFT_151335 [Guillardia theta CCMP2712]